MKKILIINLLIITTSCSYISGPEGMFPPTKNASTVGGDLAIPCEQSAKEMNTQKSREDVQSMPSLRCPTVKLVNSQHFQT